MSMMEGSPPAAQGTAGSTDVVIQLRGVVQQLSSSNTNMKALIAALQAVAFPQSLKGYTVATLPSSPSLGTLAFVTDAASGLAWGVGIGAGGHSTTYLAWFGSGGWTVVGK